METDYNMYYESNDDIFNNYEVRESIIREMAEQAVGQCGKCPRGPAGALLMPYNKDIDRG